MCKSIIGCVVLHNLLTLTQDTMVEKTPLRFAPASVAEDPHETEQPIAHEQRIAKRDDSTDILAAV